MAVKVRYNEGQGTGKIFLYNEVSLHRSSFPSRDYLLFPYILLLLDEEGPLNRGSTVLGIMLFRGLNGEGVSEAKRFRGDSD